MRRKTIILLLAACITAAGGLTSCGSMHSYWGVEGCYPECHDHGPHKKHKKHKKPKKYYYYGHDNGRFHHHPEHY